MHTRTILAIEGEWKEDLWHTDTVAPALQFLQQVCNIDFVHRRAPTKDAFLQYIDWGVQERFRIFYLAGHGDAKGIYLGSKENGTITLDDIGTCLSGRLGYNDVVVHFSTCGLMGARDKAIPKFKAQTRARLVSGYSNATVDFLDSMLLEMAWLNFLQGKGAFDKVGDFLKGSYSKLGKELGFVVV